MTQISRTAGIDTSKAKLDVAVHGGVERWQVDNTPVGWRRLAAELTSAEVMALQSEYLNRQMQTISAQVQDLGQSAAKMVVDAAKPKI